MHVDQSLIWIIGEDWTNTALTLSTVASDTFVKSVPVLRVSRIYQTSARKGLFGNGNNVGGPFGNNHPGQSVFGQPQLPQNPFPQFQQQQQQQQQQQTFQQQQTNPVAQGFGAFGNVSAPLPPAPPAGSLFGSAAPGGPTTSSFGLFGAAPATTTGGTSGFGGGGLFGSTTAAASAPAPATTTQEDVEETFEEIPGPSAFSEPTTVVTETPLSVSYAVEGEATIPSDGVAHQVSVAMLSFDSKVTHVCCPKIDARVYLQVCHVTFVLLQSLMTSAI